jgi:hypothetical protein
MHSIRLREPWERQRSGDSEIRFTRRFNCPSGIAGETVFLVISGLAENTEILLNDESLASSGVQPGGPLRVDITPLLQPANRLLMVRCGDDEALPFEEVRLEIESAQEEAAQRQ